MAYFEPKPRHLDVFWPARHSHFSWKSKVLMDLKNKCSSQVKQGKYMINRILTIIKDPLSVAASQVNELRNHFVLFCIELY